MDADVESQQQPLKTGYLWKRSVTGSAWKRRFFVLRRNVLVWFADHKVLYCGNCLLNLTQCSGCTLWWVYWHFLIVLLGATMKPIATFTVFSSTIQSGGLLFLLALLFSRQAPRGLVYRSNVLPDRSVDGSHSYSNYGLWPSCKTRGPEARGSSCGFNCIVIHRFALSESVRNRMPKIRNGHGRSRFSIRCLGAIPTCIHLILPTQFPTSHRQ